MLKRMITLAIGSLVSSVVPTTTWLLLGKFVDYNISRVYSLAYPIQFVTWIITGLITGMFTYSIKDSKNKDNSMISSLLLCIALNTIIFSIIFLNIDNYISIMNFDIDTYKLYCIQYIYNYFILGIIWYITIYYNMNDNEAIGSRVISIYNIITYSTLFITMVLFETSISIVITSLVETVYAIYYFIKIFRVKFKFTIEPLKGLKYSLASFMNNVIMLFMYAYGISNVSNNVEFSYAYSIWISVVDWTWDVSYSVYNTIVNTDVSNNRFVYNKTFKKFVQFSIGISLIVSIESLVVYFIFKPNLYYFLINAIPEIIYIGFYSIACLNNDLANLNGYHKILAIFTVFYYIIRCSLMVVVPEIWSMSMSQFVAGLFDLITSIVLIVMLKKSKINYSIE